MVSIMRIIENIAMSDLYGAYKYIYHSPNKKEDVCEELWKGIISH